MRPMLAATLNNISSLTFPVFVSQKIDGIRCLVVKQDGAIKALSRSLKPIRNKYIQEYLNTLSQYLEDNTFLDGELVCGNFQETTSSIMSADGTPDFSYLVFDYCNIDNIKEPFDDRVKSLKELFEGIPLNRVKLIEQRLISDEKELVEFYNTQLEDGYEGAIIRSLKSPYKFGRATPKEGYLFKLKPFIDDEFTITGYTPLYTNNNEQITNELGYKVRSSSQDNLEEKDMLGALLVDYNSQTLKVGSGFTEAQRINLWQNKETLIGKLAKVKFMLFNIKDLPRHPVYLGIRDCDDL